jgi:hypothetical protein
MTATMGIKRPIYILDLSNKTVAGKKLTNAKGIATQITTLIAIGKIVMGYFAKSLKL